MPLFSALGRDARYALRSLRRTPVITLTAIATLALAIGACTAVYSIADALLMRPLPYPDAGRLAYIERRVVSPRGSGNTVGMDGLAWEILRDGAQLVDVAAYGASFGNGVNLVVGNAAAIVRQQRVSAGYFSVLGVSPFIGREFTPEEDRAGGPQATVLSHALWQRYFADRTDIVGQSILLRGEPYTVVGVMPKAFINIADADVWTPLRGSQKGEGGGTNFGILARLDAGVDWRRAEAELASLSAGKAPFKNIRSLMQDEVTAVLGLRPMQDVQLEGVREPVVMLAAAVGTVLLIACVNLAALLVARGAGRMKEIATRMALGSGRRAVVRQLMVEAAVLAVAGGAFGVLAGQFALSALQALGAETYGEWQRATLDVRALAVAIGLSGVTSLIFGLVPALQTSRLDVNAALGDAGSRSVAGSARQWPRRLLVVTEVALGVVLLVTAALLIRTFINLRMLDPGFDPRNLTTARVSLLDARYATPESVTRLFDQSLARLATAPGVESAAVSLGVPYDRLLNIGFRFPEQPSDEWRTTNATYVAGDIFKTLGIGLVAGRSLAETDREQSPPVAVVNDSFARFYSKDQPALGRRIRISGIDREIVGIVGNVQQRGSGFYVEGMVQGPITSPPLVYLPASQAAANLLGTHVWFSPVWSVRARSTSEAIVAIRDAVASVDPLLPVAEPESMENLMSAAVARNRLMMTLVTVLAGAAVFLAAIGIQGLIAQSVTERRREFGIRMALGATAGQTVRSVALGGIALAAAGAVIGVGLSFWAVQLIEGFVWPAKQTDPLTYLAVGVFLLLVAATASLLPALKILKLDPATTLRS
jgi:predicted permease